MKSALYFGTADSLMVAEEQKDTENNTLKSLLSRKKLCKLRFSI